MKKPLKVLYVFDSPFEAPRGYNYKEEFKEIDWDAEKTIAKALKSNEYETILLGIHENIGLLLEEARENKPDVVFNGTEVFGNKSSLDKNVAWMIEMLGIPYTGASPTNLLVCNDKALSKKILSYHKIKVPHFYSFYRHRKIKLVKRIRLPLVVKPLCDEASRGISQASVVDNEQALVDRVRFIHEGMKMDAIAEEYVEGREFYVSVLGIDRLQVFPMREMIFGKFPEDEPRIATYKAKWDYDYCKKWGIVSKFAENLTPDVVKKISETCKRAYRALNMQSYARFDIRLTPDNHVFILEVNANPSLDPDDELPHSASQAGIPFPKLIQRIVNLAFQRHL